MSQRMTCVIEVPDDWSFSEVHQEIEQALTSTKFTLIETHPEDLVERDDLCARCGAPLDTCGACQNGECPGDDEEAPDATA